MPECIGTDSRTRKRVATGMDLVKNVESQQTVLSSKLKKKLCPGKRRCSELDAAIVFQSFRPQSLSGNDATLVILGQPLFWVDLLTG